MAMPFSGPDSISYTEHLCSSTGARILVGSAISANAPYIGVHAKLVSTVDEMLNTLIAMV